MKSIQYEMLDPLSIKDATVNPRKIGAKQKAQLKRMLLEHGYVGGVVVRGETWRLIGGHQRLAVIRELITSREFEGEELEAKGLNPLMVTVLRGYSEAEAHLLGVALNNRETQGAFDMAQLSALLSELDANGVDATLSGFDEESLEKIFTWEKELEDGDGGTDAAATLVVKVSTAREAEMLAEEFRGRGYQCAVKP